MARNSGGGISSGPMNTIIGGFIGLLVIVAVVIIGPTLNGAIQTSIPNMSQSSSWNASYNTALPTGVAMWTTNVAIGGVVILVFFISLAIYYIRVIA